MIVIKIASLLKLRHSRITSSSCSHNTRAELGLRVRDNTRALYRAGPFRERCVGYTHSGGWGPRVPRGYVGGKSTHGA